VLRIIDVTFARRTPHIRSHTMHTRSKPGRMRREIHLCRHGEHGTVPKAPGSSVKNRLRQMRCMLVMESEIVAIQGHPREKPGKIARHLLIPGI